VLCFTKQTGFGSASVIGTVRKIRLVNNARLVAICF